MTNDGIEARRMANDDAWTIKILVLLGWIDDSKPTLVVASRASSTISRASVSFRVPPPLTTTRWTSISLFLDLSPPVCIPHSFPYSAVAYVAHGMFCFISPPQSLLYSTAHDATTITTTVAAATTTYLLASASREFVLCFLFFPSIGYTTT